MSVHNLKITNNSKITKNIAFLLSGSGSTLENLLEKIDKRQVSAKVQVVISSKETAYGIKRAKKWNIPVRVIPYKLYKKDNIIEYSREITKTLDEYKVDLVVLGGFLSRYIVDDNYKNKVINIHPSLIPAFCGKGYYGLHVHKAVLEYGVKVTGCTVHFVDNNYDEGAIIAQEVVEVLPSDTPETLQKRVMIKESILYPKVIQKIIEDKVTLLYDRRVEVVE